MAVLLLDALAQITARLEALERRAAVFTATQRNMLLAMGGSRVLRFLVREGFHDVIRARLSWNIYVALFVTFISVPGIFLDNMLMALGGMALLLDLSSRARARDDDRERKADVPRARAVY